MSGKCIHCKKVLQAGFFEVRRYDRANTFKGAVRACSLLCLINWATAYGVQKGAQGTKPLVDVIRQLYATIVANRK